MTLKRTSQACAQIHPVSLRRPNSFEGGDYKRRVNPTDWFVVVANEGLDKGAQECRLVGSGLFVCLRSADRCEW